MTDGLYRRQGRSPPGRVSTKPDSNQQGNNKYDHQRLGGECHCERDFGEILDYRCGNKKCQ